MGIHFILVNSGNQIKQVRHQQEEILQVKVVVMDMAEVPEEKEDADVGKGEGHLMATVPPLHSLKEARGWVEGISSTASGTLTKLSRLENAGWVVAVISGSVLPEVNSMVSPLAFEVDVVWDSVDSGIILKNHCLRANSVLDPMWWIPFIHMIWIWMFPALCWILSIPLWLVRWVRGISFPRVRLVLSKR
jgi:hypothetical protein